MGRAIRHVPPNWDHPQRDPEHDMFRHGGLQPMYDKRFDAVWADWLAEFDRVRADKLTDFEREVYPRGLADWIHDEGHPPVAAYYRPWADEDATWVQLWETVSEGTPVSPPFATLDELSAYLAEHGDFWDQKRGDGAWGKQRAEAFCRSGWAPTMMISNGLVLTSADIPAALEHNRTPTTSGDSHSEGEGP